MDSPLAAQRPPGAHTEHGARKDLPNQKCSSIQQAEKKNPNKKALRAFPDTSIAAETEI